MQAIIIMIIIFIVDIRKAELDNCETLKSEVLVGANEGANEGPEDV